jgi:hypothetical protein
MTFICHSCLQPQKPGVKQSRITLLKRDVVYVNDHDEPVAQGNEIVKEVVVCPACELVIRHGRGDENV